MENVNKVQAPVSNVRAFTSSRSSSRCVQRSWAESRLKSRSLHVGLIGNLL